MLFNALVVGAISVCAALAGPVQKSDMLFTQADAAIAAKDIPSARIDYESGMQQLAGTPWFINDKGCDAPEYTLERYVTTLHSLVVGVGAGEMTPLDAYNHEVDVQRQLFKTLPQGAYDFFYRKYPALSDREYTYIRSIGESARPKLVAAHSPSSTECNLQNVDADVLNQAEPSYPESFQNAGIGKVTIKLRVTLDESGKITAASITQSSGVMELDQSALSAARRSMYLPAVKNCRRVPGTLNFSVTFDPSG